MTTAPEFTGERFIPGQGGAQMAYEHIHRYLLARRWCRGKRVLDIAAGSGYGAAILAREARTVIALDLDAEALHFARSAHVGGSLAWLRADASTLPVGSGSVDFATALEVLEHVENPEEMLREIARVLRPGGAALVSTPNKAAYSDARSYVNPYHVKEFYRDELEEALGRHFGWFRLMSQQVRAGSLISALSGETGREEVEAESLPGRTETRVDPLYFMALCASREPEVREPAASAYLDPDDCLLTEWAAEVRRLNAEVESLGRWGRGLEAELGERDRTLGRVLAEVEQRDETIRSLQEEMREEVGRRDEALAGLRDEFEEKGRWALTLEQAVRDRDQTLDQRQRELEKVAGDLARIRHAFLYRVLCRMGILPR